MKHFFTNWKTTLAGIATLVIAGNAIAHGMFDATTIGQVTAGVGLLIAKDGNVTGGTKPQNGGTVAADPVARRIAQNKI